MKNVIKVLLTLQTLEMGPDPEAPNTAAEIKRLRQKIPTPVLGHYDRLLARNKKGVALVRNGVCSECHMRLASGIYATLMRGEDIMICDSCGRYLHLAPEATSVPSESPAPKKTAATRRRKKSAAPPDNIAPVA